MLGSSPKSSGRVLLAAPLLAGILLGLSSGCARQAAPSEAQPEAVPQEDSTKASAREDATTASDLTSNRVRKRHQEPVESLLKGRISGVHVSRNANGTISVRIRGASSFYASSEPLYILDGTPILPGPRGALAGINPNDIESIEVLKHPPETSLYGVRGANGVILIKTKLRPE